MKIKLNKSQQIVADAHSLREHNMNRRDFMGLGLQSFAGFALFPSLFNSFAFAQQMQDLPAFVVFDLVGGAALPGNFLVGGPNGSNDLLTSYDLLGFDPRTSNMDDRFGLPAPTNISQMFEGMRNTMSAGAQQNFRLTSIANQSVDDSSNNVTSALGLIAKYWQSKGLLKQKGLGSRGTASGGRTKLSLDEPALRPEQLTTVTQLNLLTGLGFIKNEGLGDEGVADLLNSQKNIHLDQFRSLAGKAQADMIEKFEQQMDVYLNSDKGDQLDPRQVAEVQNTFGINQGSQADNEDVLIAGIVHTTLKKYTGPSCVALGGYDYHDGTTATGDRRDLRAGEIIGRSVELAHRMGQPFFFQVVTDGGCSARRDGRDWVADSGDRGMGLLGYYNPNGVNQQKTQLGFYTNGQIADINTYAGRRTSHAANLTLLNYLAAIDKVGEVEKILSNSDLPQEVIDQSIAFTV